MTVCSRKRGLIREIRPSVVCRLFSRGQDFFVDVHLERIPFRVVSPLVCHSLVLVRIGVAVDISFTKKERAFEREKALIVRLLFLPAFSD